MESKTHQCECGKSFNHRQSLLRHAKECKPIVVATVETSNNDVYQLQQQIIELKMELQRKDMELKMELQRKDMELEKKELEHAYQLQLKDMEYKLKIQELISQNTTPIQNQVQVQNRPLDNTIKEEQKSYCLKEYLNSMKPILIHDFQEQFTASIEHYTTILNNKKYEDGMARNIMNHVKNYEKNTLPIVITNSQYARFKVYIFKTDKNTNKNTWCKYEGLDAIDEIKNIIHFFSCRLLKYKTPIYNTSYSLDNLNENEIELYKIKNLSLSSALASAEQYTDKILNLIKEYFVVNKFDE